MVSLWQTSKPAVHPLPVPSALAKQELKRTTALATQSANRSWHPATGGNFSVRDGDDLCWVSPSGKHKGMLEWTDFLPVDYQKAELVQPCYAKPSDETALHCAVYRADPTARAVMHVHPPHTTALVGKDFKLSDNEMLKAFGFKTHEIDVTIPSLPNTQDMDKLGQDVKLNLELKLLVLEGHGVYAWGKTPDEAMFRIEALEFLCQLRSLNSRP
ncbi:MAG: methylthioribulose 1-phosphate dehydratase [Proteobacteria bacterium]|nr:MAG: methylthioribulose 1-phosphate dehydratase [Pseudomonadota bacterium]